MTTSERDSGRRDGAAEVPEAVQRAAQEHGLGPLVDVRRELSMTRAIGLGVGAIVVSLVALTFFGFLFDTFFKGNDIAEVIARPIGFVALFALIWGLVTAIRGLLVGSRAHYLFAGGLVAKRRSGLQAVAWPQVVMLDTRYNRKTREIVGYRVVAPGVQFMIPLVLTNNRDPFIDRIADQLRAAGRPIH